MKNLVRRILRFIVHWENRNTFCLFEIGVIDPEDLRCIAYKGITLVPAMGLEGSRLQIIRLGGNKKELEEIKELLKKYEKG